MNTLKEEIEKWLTYRTEAVSQMLDNPSSLDIYPTGRLFEELDDFVLPLIRSNRRLKEELEQMKDDYALSKWMKREGWILHSSGEYYYKSKDFHQWPPDEVCELDEIYTKFKASLNDGL